MLPQQSLPADPVRVGTLLNAIPSRVPGVVHAIALSSDGLVLAYTDALDRDHADQLAAVVSGLSSLAVSSCQVLGTGAPVYTMITMEGGTLLAMPVQDRMCLAALARPDADIGAAAGELSATVDRVGELLVPAMR